MVANGIHHDGTLIHRHPHTLENLPSDEAATQGMILSMNGIANIVQITGNIRQLRRTLRLP
jgi:hypothetical protein